MMADAVRVTIQEMDDALVPVRAMLVPKLRSLLELMQHLGSLSSFEENSALVHKINEYAAVSWADLVFTDPEKSSKSEPVALECLNRKSERQAAFGSGPTRPPRPSTLERASLLLVSPLTLSLCPLRRQVFFLLSFSSGIFFARA